VVLAAVLEAVFETWKNSLFLIAVAVVVAVAICPQHQSFASKT
jgi:hypothetical protein